MNAKRAAVNVSLASALAMVAGLLVCITPTDASAQLTYVFPNDSQGWRYMGLYDGGSLNRLDDFEIADNPWTGTDGDGGALLLGQEGFTPQSPTENVSSIHGALNSPILAYRAERTVRLTWSITGSHMHSTGPVWVQAVLLLRSPTGVEQLFPGDFEVVPIGADGAWDTHTFIVQGLPKGSIVKRINMRIFFATESYYTGWIMVDNVSLR